MSGTRGRANESLAFLILASFIASFLAARTFTTILPGAIVESAGIHFHHFWYGLVMVTASGLLAIVSSRRRFVRVYALVFGLGAGLIGDEVGLLLTLGNYQSELTYVFFTGVLAFSVLGFLLLRYWRDFRSELVSLGRGQPVAEVGLVVAGLSAIAFAFGDYLAGIGLFGAGALMTVAGYRVHRRETRV